MGSVGIWLSTAEVIKYFTENNAVQQVWNEVGNAT
jgi:hypothetical protein